MTPKEQVLKLIEGRMETMQALAIESIELIYNAGYNEGIEDAAKIAHAEEEYDTIQTLIRSLKK